MMGRPPSPPRTEKSDASMPATQRITSAPSISSSRDRSRRTPATPTSGTSVDETPRYSSARPASSATGMSAGRRGRPRPLAPQRGGEGADQHVVRPRELPADFDDLLRGLALGQHHLGEPDAPKTVEIEGVVGAAHFARILCGGCAKKGAALWFAVFGSLSLFGQGKR